MHCSRYCATKSFHIHPAWQRGWTAGQASFGASTSTAAGTSCPWTIRSRCKAAPMVRGAPAVRGAAADLLLLCRAATSCCTSTRRICRTAVASPWHALARTHCKRAGSVLLVCWGLLLLEHRRQLVWLQPRCCSCWRSAQPSIPASPHCTRPLPSLLIAACKSEPRCLYYTFLGYPPDDLPDTIFTFCTDPKTHDPFLAPKCLLWSGEASQGAGLCVCSSVRCCGSVQRSIAAGMRAGSGGDGCLGCLGYCAAARSLLQLLQMATGKGCAGGCLSGSGHAPPLSVCTPNHHAPSACPRALAGDAVRCPPFSEDYSFSCQCSDATVAADLPSIESGRGEAARRCSGP